MKRVLVLGVIVATGVIALATAGPSAQQQGRRGQGLGELFRFSVDTFGRLTLETTRGPLGLSFHAVSLARETRKGGDQ